MMTSPEPAPQIINEEDVKKRKIIEKQVTKIVKEMTEQVELVLSSGPHRDYFLGQEAKKLKLKEMNSKYSNLIQSKLFLEIQTGQTKISRNKTSYIIQPKPQLTLEEIIQKDKNEIKLKKKHAIQALDEILREENNFVKHQRGLKESRSLNKSHLSIQQNPEWKQHIKQAIKRKHELERSLEIKTKQAQRRALLIKQQMVKAKMEKMEKQRTSNLKLLTQRKQKQLILRQQQKQFKTKCQQFVRKSKPKRYRFEVMSERGEEQQKIFEQQRQQKIKQFKQMRQKYDWSELKQHESQYFQIINERKQQWVRKFQSSLSRVNKRHEKSIFAQKIKEEEEQKQLEEKLRENKKHQFLSRIKQYGESVLENHRPRKFIKSSNQLMKGSNSMIRNSLNRFQQRQKGITYLNEVKNHRKLTSEIKSNVKVSSSLPTIKTPAYKDYLKQQPKRAKEGTFYSVLTEKKGEWASNAKSIIQKMDINNKKDDKKLLESAFKKIELLKAIL